MKRVWSEEGKLERWLEVELAALDGWAELGVGAAARRRQRRGSAPSRRRPSASPRSRSARTTTSRPSSTRSRRELGPERSLVPLRAHVLGRRSTPQPGPAGSRGRARSSSRASTGALAAVIAGAEEHRDTVMVGRTHGVHAEPITFGVKLAGWAFELARDRSRLVAALERMRVGKLAGAVGTYGGGDPEMEQDRLREARARARAGRNPGRPAGPARGAALDAGALRRVARAPRDRDPPPRADGASRSPGPFGKGQKGSSAMPHKRNPVVAERICGLARVVRAAAAVGLENVALWHERDISHSSTERVVLPDAFLALDYMLDRFTWLTSGLVVDAGRMRENLDASHGLVFSQRVLLALVGRGALPRRGVSPRAGARSRGVGRAARPSASWSPPIRRSAPVSTPRRWRPPSTSTTPSGTSRSSSNASAPSPRRSSNERRRASMPEAAHVASGKVREIFELEADRLLLVASDRISTFDVVLPTEIPTKGGCSRASRASGSHARARSSRTTSWR